MSTSTGVKPKRRLGVGAILLAGSLALSACGSTGAGAGSGGSATASNASDSAWTSILAKADQEGALNLYWSMGTEDSEPHLLAAFRQAYPKIKIKITFQGTSDLINRLDQETSGHVKSADAVIHSSPGWFATNQKAGTFTSLQVSPDNVSAGWDHRLNGQNFATWFGFQYLIGHSTKVQVQQPDLQAILTANPRAKIGLVDPHISPATANGYDTLRKAYGDGILDQLSKADYTIYSSNSTLSAGLAAGAVDYAYPDQKNTTGPLIAKGAPVAQVLPTKGQAGASYNVAVLALAPHPDAGQVWANFVMSSAGQKAIVADNSPAATVPTNVAGAIPWGTVSFLDPAKWTTDPWNQWIATYWTPRFSK